MTAATINEPVSLKEVLDYRQDGVVRRYAKEHHTSIEEAEDLFEQMLKWLYLCSRSSAPLSMTPELEKIDWMWHTFLLFTRDYADFCLKHFGCFLHHIPNEDEEEEGEDTQIDTEAARLRWEEQFGLIYDVLGEETLTAWYDRCSYAAR